MTSSKRPDPNAVGLWYQDPERELKIPEVRTRLERLATRLEATGQAEASTELRYLIDQLWRRPAVRKAPPSTAPMTPERADSIRAAAAANPDVSMFDIGAKHNVNQGRVSEAVAGRRGDPRR